MRIAAVYDMLIQNLKKISMRIERERETLMPENVSPFLIGLYFGCIHIRLILFHNLHHPHLGLHLYGIQLKPLIIIHAILRFDCLLGLCVRNLVVFYSVQITHSIQGQTAARHVNPNVSSLSFASD